MSELVVPKDYLDLCQNWQEIINAQDSTELKDAAGKDARVALAGQTFYDHRPVIVKGDAALYLPDGFDSIDERLWPIVQFGQLVAKGWLGRLSYIRLRAEAFLTWDIYEPSVLGPGEDEYVNPRENEPLQGEEQFRLPLDVQLCRPFHFPVGLIDYALLHKK